MTLKTQYSNKEIEILESYSHRLNNKIHISFPGGTFGDMLWASIFVTNTLSHMKDISEVCQITPEGRVLRGDVKDATHFAFKGGNAINDKLKTRYDILFAVYMATNKSAHEFSNIVFTSEIDNAVTDTINKIDKGNDYHTVSDTVLSHCCDEANSNLMSMFETEFNQKLIFIMPNESDAEFYGEICSRKTDINNEYDWIFTPDITNIKNNITDNSLVINPNRFVLDEETYIECVKEILDFIEMKVDADEINKMISYRTFWYNKQPKYIHDYNFKI